MRDIHLMSWAYLSFLSCGKHLLLSVKMLLLLKLLDPDILFYIEEVVYSLKSFSVLIYFVRLALFSWLDQFLDWDGWFLLDWERTLLFKGWLLEWHWFLWWLTSKCSLCFRFGLVWKFLWLVYSMTFRRLLILTRNLKIDLLSGCFTWLRSYLWNSFTWWKFLVLGNCLNFLSCSYLSKHKHKFRFLVILTCRFLFLLLFFLLIFLFISLLLSRSIQLTNT